jgi:MauM/NapG family ferredoxin protein
MTRTRKPVKKWVWARRISQWIWLVIFFWLFFRTDFRGTDEISRSVGFFFRINPLIGTAAMITARVWINFLLPGLFFLLSALFLGRWFCGWMCPMGTLLDATHPVIRGKQTAPGNPRRNIRFVLLFAILVAAVFGLPLVGFFDPFAILVRGLTVSLYPAFDYAARSFFTFTWQQGNTMVHALTEPVYSALRATVLPFGQMIFQWSIVSGLLLLAVFILEKWERRAFCRNICPLGAFYGLVARIGMFRGRRGDAECGGCAVCRRICRMGAIDDGRNISMTDCNVCMECVEACPRGAFSFTWSSRKTAVQPAGSGMSRRTFIGAALTGAALPALGSVQADKRNALELIRPPGAKAEDEFLARCVRCGKCMKVCVGNALHPALFETGVSGMFSPMVLPRVGYCEYNCTLCGQVCPTGAIEHLSLEKKREWVIGTASFDTSRCLPYRGINCLVCEEHCPVPGKAIHYNEVEMARGRGQTTIVRQPFVRRGRCIGCGICENKCPLTGPAAVRVTSLRETRHN